LQLARAVGALVERHGDGEYTLDGTGPEQSPFGRSQTPKDGGLRQPAAFAQEGTSHGHHP
jgi:hypothetical protein